MNSVHVSSSTEIISAVRDAVLSGKTSDPFAPIIVLGKRYHLADRAISRVIKNTSQSLVNVSSATPREMLRELSFRANVKWSVDNLSRELPAVIRDVLPIMGGEWGKVDAENDVNIAVLAKLIRQFDWVDTRELTIDDALSSISNLTALTTDTIRFIQNVQTELTKRDLLQPCIVLARFKDFPREELEEAVRKYCPVVIVLGDQIPTKYLEFLELFGSQVTHIAASVHIVPIAIGIHSTPDPETECSLAIDFIGEAIRDGVPATSIAIGYSDAMEYLPILERALDEAGIDWFGKTSDSALATKPSKAFQLMLAVAERYKSGSKVNREQILELCSLGNVPATIQKRDGSSVDVPLERDISKYLIDDSLFGDSQSWRSQLSVTQSMFEQLLQEREIAVADDDDELLLEIDKQLRTMTAAIALRQILQKFDDHFAKIDSWDSAMLVTKCVSAIRALLWDSCWQDTGSGEPKDTRSIAAYSVIRSFSETRSPNDLIDFDAIRTEFIAELESLSVRRGSYRAGVVVAPISEIAYSDWDIVAVVGCDEATIANVGREHPLLPDSVIEVVRSHTGSLFETSADRKLKSANEVALVANSTGTSRLSFARAGNLKNRETKALSLFESTPASDVPTSWDYFDQATASYRSSVRRIKNGATSSTSTEIAKLRPFNSAVAFRRPENTPYFGILTLPESLNGLDRIENRVLSASYVERYLECPHHFFVTKVLGVSDDEAEMEIDEVKATDFGIAIHNAMQFLIDPSAEGYPSNLVDCTHSDPKALVPKNGESFGDEALTHLLELFQNECGLLVSRSVAGWAPRFREKGRIFERNAAHYLRLDDVSRSYAIEWNRKVEPGGVFAIAGKKYQCEELAPEDKLSPLFAEFPFGEMGKDPFEFVVEIDDDHSISLKFRGRIDRVDANRDRTNVSIIDYKSSKASSLLSKAGKKIQDLLYPLAILQHSEFSETNRVTSLYLTMNDSVAESATVRLGTQGDSGAAAREIDTTKEILSEVLLSFAGSFVNGSFPPAQATKSKSGTYCPTCLKVGVRIAHRATIVSDAPLDDNPKMDGGL